MVTFLSGIIFAAVVFFIATRSRSARSKIHEFTKPKEGGVTKEK